MASNQHQQEKNSSLTQIVLAVISVVGILGTATLQYWGNLFPSQASLVDSNTAPSSSSTDVPSGNYQLTCSSISVRSETLTANCLNKQGGLQESSLIDFKRCTFGIENYDGRLACRLAR